jgi:hypothetical protein
MTIKRLIGPDPNQISLNRDLGTMAFQDYIVKPVFRVGLTSDSTSYTNDAPIKFASNIYNPSNCYDFTTGRFTAPLNGFYHFDTTVRVDANQNFGAYFRIRPHKNGAQQEWLIGDAINGTYVSSQAYMSAQISFSIELVTGDYIDIRVGWASALTSVVLSNSGFSGFLVA